MSFMDECIYSRCVFYFLIIETIIMKMYGRPRINNEIISPIIINLKRLILLNRDGHTITVNTTA